MFKINSCPRFFLYTLIVVSAFFVSAPLARAALVDINTAGIEELDTLDGIGPAYAQRIVDYRTANGLFQSIDEIKNVSGIGESTFAKIRNSITVSGGTSQTTSTNSNTYSTESAHYVSLPVAEEVKDDEIRLSAGRDRIVVAGSPAEFRAETNKTFTKQNIFSWNFGDGTISGGQEISHTYEYPGEYVVVLNANFSAHEAIARANVKVVEPNFSITAISPERVEVTNNSKYEVSLFGRAIVSGESYFIFPKDTIIKAGQKVSFSSKVTGLTDAVVMGVNLMVLEEASLEQNIRKKIEENKLVKINEIRNNIAVLERRVASIISENKSKNTKEILGEVAIDDQEETNQIASVIQSQPISNKESGGLLGILKRFFLKNK